MFILAERPPEARSCGQTRLGCGAAEEPIAASGRRVAAVRLSLAPISGRRQPALGRPRSAGDRAGPESAWSAPSSEPGVWTICRHGEKRPRRRGFPTPYPVHLSPLRADAARQRGASAIARDLTRTRRIRRGALRQRPGPEVSENSPEARKRRPTRPAPGRDGFSEGNRSKL